MKETIVFAVSMFVTCILINVTKLLWAKHKYTKPINQNIRETKIMKHSILWIILLWMMGIGFIGYAFLNSTNIMINSSSLFFIFVIDVIAIFSIIWLGISRWIVESISRLIN